MKQNIQRRLFLVQSRRGFSSSHHHNDATWERAARRVKNTDSEKNNFYLDAIRETHDPSMHLKTIEDELKGTIGKALGKQGQKIHYFVKLMQDEYLEYKDACAKNSPQERARAAQKFNDYRKQALHARWELTVHRQAAGFIVNNHRYVIEHYPIADALNETADNTTSTGKHKEDKTTPKKKQFGDQLDWWQKIGRWR